MKYLVKFTFYSLGKNNRVSGKAGEVEVTTEANLMYDKRDEDLKTLITNDMESKTKKNVILVEIIDIRECKS